MYLSVLLRHFVTTPIYIHSQIEYLCVCARSHTYSVQSTHTYDELLTDFYNAPKVKNIFQKQFPVFIWCTWHLKKNPLLTNWISFEILLKLLLYYYRLRCLHTYNLQFVRSYTVCHQINIILYVNESCERHFAVYAHSYWCITASQTIFVFTYMFCWFSFIASNSWCIYWYKAIKRENNEFYAYNLNAIYYICSTCWGFRFAGFEWQRESSQHNIVGVGDGSMQRNHLTAIKFSFVVENSVGLLCDWVYAHMALA